MNLRKYIVSLDSSSSACKVFLVDEEGSVVHSFHSPIKTINNSSGFIEHDPEDIWSSQLKALEGVIFKASPEEIIGLSITNQRETIIAWSRSTGKPIYNAISWQDRRNKGFLEEYGEYRDLIRRKTGLVLDLYFSASKIKWILENIEWDVQDLCVGTVDSWLIFKFTGLFLTDVTNASRTLLFNIYDEKWDEELLRIFNIPRGILPEVKSSEGDFGCWNYRGYEIPICGVIGDQQAALLTVGLDSMLCTYGTGLFLLTGTGNKIIFSDKTLTTIALKLDGFPTYYALECGSFVGGNFIKSLYEEGLFSSYEIESKDVIDAAYIRMASGKLFIFDDREYGDFIHNFDISKNKGEYCLKASLNGIALIIDSLISRVGLDNSTIWINGGLTRIPYLNQLQSSMSNKNIMTTDNSNYSCMGAAYLGLLSRKVMTMEQLKNINIKNVVRYNPQGLGRFGFLDSWSKVSSDL